MKTSNSKKLICLVLCVLLLCATAGISGYAIASKDTVSTSSDETAPVEDGESGIYKDETLYIVAGADGAVEKVIVSDWIKNNDGEETLEDNSELEDVEVVKGDATYTINSDNMRVWNTNGEDVYYQGSTDKELPVALSVSYKLDGNPISAEDLAGKSGRVTMHFDYVNNEYEMVEIDGKEEKMYVPFVMLTGMLLDSEKFSNVEVSNGKLMDDGSRVAVIGFALPGLQDNLAVSKEDIDIPDYVEISADVEDFELSTVMTIATNEMFSALNTDELDDFDFDDIEGSVTQLTGAMDQILDGSSQLYDGLCTLLEKSGDLINGVDKFVEGAFSLKSGAGQLAAGAGKVENGSAALYSGLNTLSGSNDTLVAGAKQVFDSLLAEATKQLKAAGLIEVDLTVDNYSTVLNGILTDLDGKGSYAESIARQSVEQIVRANEAQIRSGVAAVVEQEVRTQVTATVKETVRQQVLAAMQLDNASYDEGVASGVITAEQQAQIASAVEQQMASDVVKTQIEENVTLQMASEAVQNTISTQTEAKIQELVNQNMSSSEIQSQINAATALANQGATSVRALKTQLDSYNQFYQGLITYTNGVASAAAGAAELNGGAAELKKGADTLASGADTLYSGAVTLKEGATALLDGEKQLCDGSMQLNDGLKEFNEKGIRKITELMDGDVAEIALRFKATLDVAKDYKSFSGKSDGMDGQVRFVYRLESIKTEDASDN